MKTRRVTMGMTPRDISNTKYLQERFSTTNKASAVSAALEFLADLERMLTDTGGHLIVEHQDGSRERITLEKEFF